jgi:hypothetical protein
MLSPSQGHGPEAPIGPDAELFEAPVGSGLYTNNYIQAFYQVVVRLAVELTGKCNTFEIWNEPNVDQSRMHSDRLGALLYYCAANVPDGTTLVGGGLFYNDNAFDAAYLTGSELDGEVGLYGPDNIMVQLWHGSQTAGAPRPYPWDHLAIHPYFALNWSEPTHKNAPTWGNGISALATFLQTMIDMGDLPGGDNPLIWVTECGVKRVCDDDSNPNCLLIDGDAMTHAEELWWLFSYIFGTEQIYAAIWQTHQNYNEFADPTKLHYGLTNYSQSLGTPPEILSIGTEQHWPAWNKMKTLTAAA